MQMLEYLDEKGDLRRYALFGDRASIKDTLNSTMISGVGFDVDVCRLNCSSTLLPANKTIVSVDYYVTGYKYAYNISKVKLWMWRK